MLNMSVLMDCSFAATAALDSRAARGRRYGRGGLKMTTATGQPPVPGRVSQAGARIRAFCSLRSELRRS